MCFDPKSSQLSWRSISFFGLSSLEHCLSRLPEINVHRKTFQIDDLYSTRRDPQVNTICRFVRYRGFATAIIAGISNVLIDVIKNFNVNKKAFNSLQIW